MHALLREQYEKALHIACEGSRDKQSNDPVVGVENLIYHLMFFYLHGKEPLNQDGSLVKQLFDDASCLAPGTRRGAQARLPNRRQAQR